jgi:HCOMODA/2-hydroxy-3-carboxy-muconic semialdehyde decarboxylase
MMDYYVPQPNSVEEASSQLVLANRVLAIEGIFDHLGHVSVRSPENDNSFLISRSLAPEQVTPDDILKVDLAGNVVTQTTERPYSERVIHAAIYRARADVNCVIHAHPEEIIILSVTGIPVKMVHHLSTLFHKGVPIFDDYDFNSADSQGMLVRTGEEAHKVASTLGNCMGMLMRGHGCNVVGESIPHAVQNAIALRDNVAMQLVAEKLGTVKTISTEEARIVSRAISEPKRGWNYWVSRAMAAMPDLQKMYQI